MSSNHSSHSNPPLSTQLNLLPSSSSLFPSVPYTFNSPYDSDIDTETTASLSSASLSSIPSTHSTTPVEPIAFQPLYHNPRFVGSIPYYYPRRPNSPAISPIVTSIITSEPLDPSTPTFASSTTLPETHEPNRSSRLHQSTLDSCWKDFQSSCSPLQKNEHWGDNIEIKNNHTFRIFLQNLNSCSLSSDTTKWRNIIDSMNGAYCDIINFAQTSLNQKFMPLRKRMRKVISQAMPIYKLNIVRNKFIYEQRTSPGDTA